MRLGLFALAVVAFLAAAFFVAGAGGDSSLAQESVTVDMGPAEGPDGGGDQTGTATLNAMDGQTEVVVDIDPSPDGADVEQPAHIHSGTCDNLGGVEYPLENVVNGQSTTVVDVSLADLQAGTFAINVHKSGEEVGVYTSCGDIPAAAQDTASPTATAAGAPQTGECTTTIVAGDTVLWEYREGTAGHTVTECGDSCDSPTDSPVFDSGRLLAGDTFSFAFDQPGTYLYYCEFHTVAMRATIVVQPQPTPAFATAPPDTPTPSPAASPSVTPSPAPTTTPTPEPTASPAPPAPDDDDDGGVSLLWFILGGSAALLAVAAAAVFMLRRARA